MNRKVSADLLIFEAEQILTLNNRKGLPKIGREMRDLGILKNGSIAIRDGKIVWIGNTKDVKKKVLLAPRGREISAESKVVMPGFVDAHTHLVYGGWREKEFEMRLQGKSYLEIAKNGGGIHSTVYSTRKASQEKLVDISWKILSRMLSWGTTTVEVKSGYGLDKKSEIKILEVIKNLNQRNSIELIPTFMGAHEVPKEYKHKEGGKKEYVRFLMEEMIPEVAEKKLARFCDVFCEHDVFSIEESRKILEKGKEFGLRPKIHADELTSSGGAELAGEIGAISAEHLVNSSKMGLQAMRKKGVIGVILPGTSFSLKMKYAPVRTMIEMGIPVALGTDHNPGTCTIEGMPLIIGLACLELGMTSEEAITASTLNAAFAVGEGDNIGSLEVGKKADIIILDIPDYHFIAYQFSTNHTDTVIKYGKVVFERGNI